MAISTKRTLLSLDRFARILEINPVHFSGCAPISLSNGRVLFPLLNQEQDVLPQFSWQSQNLVSRDAIASEIALAELNIAKFMGCFPAPTWITDERHDLPGSYNPSIPGKVMTDPAGNERSCRPSYGNFISGGQRGSVLVQSSATVTYRDDDADTWSENGYVSVDVTGIDESEVKVYFAGHNGDPLFEIRDPFYVSITGNTLTLGFRRWQLVNPDLQFSFPTTEDNLIDLSDPLSTVSSVDVFREFNDYSKPHGSLYTQDPNSGLSQVDDCFIYQLDDQFIVPVAGTYNTSLGVWERKYPDAGYGDYVKINYYAGMKDPNSSDGLSSDMATAIAYLASARLDRVFYTNNNATAKMAKLAEDLSEGVSGQFRVVPKDLTTNPFGTRRGEYMAYKLITRYNIIRNTGGSL